MKYIARAGRKGDLLEDLLKAHWYLTREIENERKKRNKVPVYRGTPEDNMNGGYR